MNKYLSGTKGQVWFGGELLANLKSIEAKVTGEFEDITVCGSYSTEKEYLGWTGEGSMTLQKIDSSVIKAMADAYQKGTMPSLKIVTKLVNASSGKAERVAITGITVSEFMLAKFEAKAVIEEEIPFSFTDYEIIETI